MRLAIFDTNVIVSGGLKLGSVPLENGPAGGRKFGAGIVRAIGKGLKT